MNVKDLQERIIRSMEWAQNESKAPRQDTDPSSWLSEVYGLRSENDRLRAFVAILAGAVQTDAPQLSAALATFLSAKPGAPLSALTEQAPSGSSLSK